MSTVIQNSTAILAELQGKILARRNTVQKYVREDERVQAILKQLRTDGGFIDEHNNQWREQATYAVFVKPDVKTGEEKTHVVSVLDGSYFTTNPLVLDPNSLKVHLSRWSLGGFVPKNTSDEPLHKRLMDYNDQSKGSLLVGQGVFLALYTFTKGQQVEQILI